MTASTAVVTMVISIPFPPTRGYFNLGDAMVMLCGILFGARIGGIAGGVGSALSDVLLGYGYFAPLTLLIKGTEGFLTGLIGSSKRTTLKVAGVASGALAMLVGYFGVETPLYGIGPAFAELATINWVQVTAGGIIALTLAQVIIRTYPEIRFLQPQRRDVKSGVVVILVAIVALCAIVGLYILTGISP
jgi:uncharacterized membrane protein